MANARRRYGILGVLALSVALVSAGAAGTAGAAPSSGVDKWVVPQAQQGGEYWTAARMRAAVPGRAIVDGNGKRVTKSAAVKSGSPTGVASQSPTVTPKATQIAAVSHIGKVFFTLGGTDYVCSGNSIASANKSTVVTAGHCVNEGPGAFATRWVFVPAYQNGSAPYGQWSASTLSAPSQWTGSGDINYDTGFATVARLNGATLSDTVGASGVAFNQSRGLSYGAFGYPAAAPFDGQTLQSCNGIASDDPNNQTQSQGIPCDMTGGSSGGPWFIGGSSGGVQNSINSFGYSNVPNTMFGPYWGSVIQGVYNSASA
jgi:V8-like Glu-specific endopeptidase